MVDNKCQTIFKCIKPKMTKSEYKAVVNSKNNNRMFFFTKCQPMVGITLRFVNNERTKQSDMNERLMTVESTVENMSRSLNKIETDVGAVKESVE